MAVEWAAKCPAEDGRQHGLSDLAIGDKPASCEISEHSL